MINPLSNDKFSTQSFNTSGNKPSAEQNKSSTHSSAMTDSVIVSKAVTSEQNAAPRNGLPLASPEAAHNLVQQLTAGLTNNTEQARAAYHNISAATVEATLG